MKTNKEYSKTNSLGFILCLVVGLLYFLTAVIVSLGPAVLSTYLFKKMDKKLIEYGMRKSSKKWADVWSTICQIGLYLGGSVTLYRIFNGVDKKNIVERVQTLEYWSWYIVIGAFFFVPSIIFYTIQVVEFFRSIKSPEEIKRAEEKLREDIEEENRWEYEDQKKREYKSKQEDSDPFQILGIPSTATALEIKKAYYKVVGQYHPDKVASLAPEFKAMAEEKSKIINRAYEECLKKVA
jgi:hypothetical protein